MLLNLQKNPNSKLSGGMFCYKHYSVAHFNVIVLLMANAFVTFISHNYISNVFLSRAVKNNYNVFCCFVLKCFFTLKLPLRVYQTPKLKHGLKFYM